MGKPMTRKRLERYRRDQADVNRLSNLARKKVRDKVRGSMDEHPYTEVDISVAGLDERLVRRYRQKKRHVEAEREAILAFVSEIDDLRIAELILLRYVDGKTWLEVWFSQGCLGSVDSHRKALLRFLNTM